MPPGIGYGDGATGILEGLVGGFLMGHDFRTQRDDRKRRLAQEQQAAMQAAEDRRIAAEDRQRGRAIEDVNLRTQHGLAYDPSAPSGAAATPLTRAVQAAYNVPEGFRRVGPSAQERAETLRRGVGSNFVSAFGLDMSPDAAADLHEGDMLDDYLERTVPRTSAPETLATGGGPIQWNAAKGAWEPVMVGGERALAPGAGGGVPTIQDLPVEMQRAVAVIGPALHTLDRYEQASRAYLTRNPVSRGLGRVGIPSAGRDQDIGELESLQASLVLSVKELAGLGVLSQQDERIVLNLIGDPLSAGAVIRDPDSVLAKIQEGRRFLEGKVSGIAEANPGLDLSGLTRRAAPGEFSALSDEEILARLMSGGQ